MDACAGAQAVDLRLGFTEASVKQSSRGDRPVSPAAFENAPLRRGIVVFGLQFGSSPASFVRSSAWHVAEQRHRRPSRGRQRSQRGRGHKHRFHRRSSFVMAAGIAAPCLVT
jgi:hypothetical protein